MTGGGYSLTGGFWSLLNVIQVPGVPILLIVPNGPDSVQIRWPNTGAYTLQQNSDLATGNWVTTGYPITTGAGTNNCTITPPVDKLFFRLAHP